MTPFIDIIDAATLNYVMAGKVVGAFTWSGSFSWMERDIDGRDDPIAPVQSPTMAGGLFAMDRQYFWEMGSYDQEMEIWGGENLEMSFRIWMCGGNLEMLPCSRVGHIFRSFRPYSNPGSFEK